MARHAIPFRGVFKKLQAVRLGRGQSRLTRQPGVVFGTERGQRGCPLISGERLCQQIVSPVHIVQRIGAVDRQEGRGIGAEPEFLDHARPVGVRHFDGIEERRFRLILQCRRAAIEKLAANLILCVRVKMESWRISRIHRCRCVAVSKQYRIDPRRCRHAFAGVREGEGRAVTASAGLPSRLR